MNAECFKKMFLPCHRKLYGVAYRLLESAEDAEDVLQEAYLKLWEKREGLAIICNPEAFCVTLVKNMCLDLLRSDKYRKQRQSVELTAADLTLQTETTEAQEEAQVVKQLIGQLPDKQRRVVVLRDVKGCTFEEIGRITGLTESNIRVLLSRARKKIRDDFNKWNDYEKR